MLSQYYSDYVSLFCNWFEEEEFEDEQLIEEFIENKDDYKESFFIQYLQENVQKNKFTEDIAKKIFNDLLDALNGKIKLSNMRDTRC